MESSPRDPDEEAEVATVLDPILGGTEERIPPAPSLEELWNGPEEQDVDGRSTSSSRSRANSGNSSSTSVRTE